MKPECWKDKDGKTELLGQARYGEEEIWLAEKDGKKILPESSVADTFLHEVIHSISRRFGIELRERQIAGLVGGLLAVIRDNNLDFRK
jgi:hypothetical protein